jgi:hypothetical protein
MDEQERLKLELALEDLLRRDLGSIPVRPFAMYSDGARSAAASPARRMSSFAGTVSVVALAVLIALGGAFALRELRPNPPSGPVPGVTASASPSATPSEQPTLATATPPVLTTTAPPASGVPSPSVTPLGFVLPQGCRYVGEPTRTTFTTDWKFDCGAAANRDAVQTLSPAFTQQGWTLCKSGQGRGFWWKATTETIVSQVANDFPLLSQLPRDMTDCP